MIKEQEKKISKKQIDSTAVKERKKEPGFLNPKLHRRLNSYIFLPASVVLCELLFKIFVLHSLSGFFYTVFSALAIGSFMLLIVMLSGRKARFWVTFGFAGLTGVLLSVQCVYHRIFSVFLSLGSALSGTAGVAKETNFVLVTVATTVKCLPQIVLFFAPMIILTVFRNKWFGFSMMKNKRLKIVAMGTLVLYIFSLGINALTGITEKGRHDDNSAFCQYFCSEFNVERSVILFGVTTTFRLDAQHLVFGKMYHSAVSGTKDEGNVQQDQIQNNEDVKNDTSPNIMNIDFDRLLADESNQEVREMHEYFKSATPTNKNKYTGLFKGCNLIYMTCESLSHYAINEKLTPTLYKLANEGIVCKNFYNPIFGVSTSDGEYANCVGLLPKSGVWSLMRSGSMYLPFALGNQFRKLSGMGYGETFAYHNNTFDYYDRDISHPNLGYTYKALGNGLEVEKTWPESDLEMMEKSIPDYINQEKFSVYYMTVSGHMDYNWSGNAMSYKHKQEVDELNLSEGAKAYLACNIELDKAMEYLLKKLAEAGKLENTVIVMGPDHYPYGLQKSEIDELAGHTVDEVFELYKSSCIIWKAGMGKNEVNEPVSSMDLLPTVSNLFGLEYDSRLLAGRDIFGGTMPLVIFDNQSFLTDKCAYNSADSTMTYLTNNPIPDGYIESVKNIVSNRFKMSERILDNHYYNIIFGVE